ncbi:hypothetical protein FIBSPDRAFT_964793 [Athelia psychrophila]|uniref:Phosphogluconate dehydrogenase NAD-binding putative C-terminal domain-containing protein n=1 Tax=Athelia psychrophila TaxID=1759441 RepID=A0A165XE68_9AGAM|nr:hypothetical protein FIBSPDRAFT_964793 [Fibularhizoctonia sp. CBS 109695]
MPANALMHELKASQAAVHQLQGSGYAPRFEVSHRWVGEMEEIAGTVGGEEGKIMAKVYSSI